MLTHNRVKTSPGIKVLLVGLHCGLKFMASSGCALILTCAALAQTDQTNPTDQANRMPVLTRHSGVIRMQSWTKGFVFNNWVGPYQKTAYVGPGDWIELSGSGAQADVVFPDLTTIQMRKAAEVQLLTVGKTGHEIAVRSGISLDFVFTEVPVTVHLPGNRALRWRGGDRLKADMLIQFDRHFDRIRVHHVRGEPLEVVKQGRVVRMLDSGQTVFLQWDEEREGKTSGEHELNRRFVFRVADRRIEIPPGVLYKVDGRRVSFWRDPILGSNFGTIRIDDEVLVVGPGSVVEVTLPENP